MAPLRQDVSANFFKALDCSWLDLVHPDQMHPIAGLHGAGPVARLDREDRLSEIGTEHAGYSLLANSAKLALQQDRVAQYAAAVAGGARYRNQCRFGIRLWVRSALRVEKKLRERYPLLAAEARAIRLVEAAQFVVGRIE